MNIKPGTIEYKILLEFLGDADKTMTPAELSEILRKRYPYDPIKYTHSTINSALKRMEDRGLLKWIHYKHIYLLEKGKRELKHIADHIHLIEIFLKDTLDLPDEDAATESRRLAPYFSCRLIEKVCNKYPYCSRHVKHILKYCSN